MLGIEKAFIDYFVRLIDEVNPIGSDISLNDKLLIKDIESNEAKSVTVADILSYVGVSGPDQRIVKYDATLGQTASVMIENSNGIALDDLKIITGADGSVILDFGSVSAPNWGLSCDGGSPGAINYLTGWVYGDTSAAQFGYNTYCVIQANNTGIFASTTDGVSTVNMQLTRSGGIYLFNADGTMGGGIAAAPGDITIGDTNHTQVEIRNNSVAIRQSGNITKYATFIGTQNSQLAAGVINSVIVGGNGLYGKSNGVTYMKSIGYATNSSFETLVEFDAPLANNFLSFPNASGTIMAATIEAGDFPTKDATKVLNVKFAGQTFRVGLFDV